MSGPVNKKMALKNSRYCHLLTTADLKALILT